MHPDSSSTPHGLGFACAWWRPRETTWSYTPASLRAGFDMVGIAVRDIEAQPWLPVQAAAAAWLRLTQPRPWKYARAYRSLETRRVNSALRRLRPQALVQMADLAVPADVPSWSYQDMGYAVAAALYDELGPEMVSTFRTSRDILRALADEQAEALQKISGVFTMGRWYADYLVRNRILPANKVVVAGGGMADYFREQPARRVRSIGERTRILFVGGDFLRKGGDWVVEAIQRLNQSGDRRLQLTIAGPSRWPLAGTPPEWVNFRGTLPRIETQRLFAEHDLFVMPSRFEAYGVVFLEARSAGLPCIGRDAWAMPELIEEGIGGALWRGSDTSDLAQIIDRALNDDALHVRCASKAKTYAERNGWPTTARRIADHLGIHANHLF